MGAAGALFPARGSSDAHMPGALSPWLAGAGVALGVHGMKPMMSVGALSICLTRLGQSCGAGLGCRV